MEDSLIKLFFHTFRRLVLITNHMHFLFDPENAGTFFGFFYFSFSYFLVIIKSPLLFLFQSIGTVSLITFSTFSGSSFKSSLPESL